MSAQNNQIQQTYDALAKFVSQIKNQAQPQPQPQLTPQQKITNLEQQCSYFQQVIGQLQVELVRYKTGYEKEFKDGEYREAVIAELNSKIGFIESNKTQKIEEYERRISSLKDKTQQQHFDIKYWKDKNDSLREKMEGMKEVINKVRESARERERKLEKQLEEIKISEQEYKADAKRYRQERNELREKIIEISSAAKKVKSVRFDVPSLLESDLWSPELELPSSEVMSELSSQLEDEPLTPVVNTFPTIAEKLDTMLSTFTEKSVLIIEENKTYQIAEENLVEDKWFYTTTVNEAQKLAVLVNTFMWFSAISPSYSQAIKYATKSCIKLPSTLNNMKRQRIFLTGKGVVEVCKEILRLTGDEFSSQVERIISVVPFLVWDF